MQKHILNTDRRTFLVTFQHRTSGCRYIFQDAHELMFLLKQNDNGKRVESIKEFQPFKGNFTRVSKKDFLKFASWETEASEYLTSHPFFK